MPYGVSLAELRTVESLLLPSGYTGVYPKGPSWQARLPWFKTPLGTDRTPAQAAARLIHWWREQFGDRWAEVYADRHLPAVEIVPDDAAPGWVAFAHVEGFPTEVVPAGRANWPTYAAARSGAAAWLRAELGLWADSPCVVRRGPAVLRYARESYPPAATVALPRRTRRRRSRRRSARRAAAVRLTLFDACAA